MKGPAYTADAVRTILKRLLEGEGADDFLSYAREIVRQKLDRGEYGTAESWKAQLDKLELFSPGLTFGDITPEFLRDYETWLLSERGNRSSTAHKAIKILRAAYYTALREGRVETNPFLKYTLPSSRPRPRERLSEAQVKLLTEASGLAEPQALARDLFLFAVYTGGMRFSDVVTLTPEAVRGDRIVYTSRKTGKVVGVPIVPEAREILSRQPKGKYLFPVIGPGPLHIETGRANARTNRSLSRLSGLLGLSGLSFHMARHTLADLLRRKGWSVYDISKLLGHRHISQTQTYLASLDQIDLDEKFRKVF